MLGLIYIFVTAKPISIRRLCLLLILLIAVARCMTIVLRREDVATAALGAAAAATVLVWFAPLARVAIDSLSAGRIVVKALD